MPLEPYPLRPEVAERLLALSGPSIAAEPGCLASRGDLAHIKLAGRCFVPHYAVPMLHRTKANTVLLTHARVDAEVITTVDEGAVFEVLDIAGAWTWGQLENDGLVGYVALTELEAMI